MGQWDLNAAVVLVRVVQAGSFSLAARQLGMTKSSVSRKVAELEERLGAQLLHRTTRTLGLTDAGAAFMEQAESALASLEAAEQAVSELQRAPRGRLRVTTTVNAGRLFMAPLLTEFLGAYPDVEVSLHLTDRQVDLVTERFDVALRAGPLPDSSLVALRLGSLSFRLVASPGYLAAHGTPMKPADLATHNCLHFAKTGSATRGTWPLGKGKRVRDVPVSGRLVADDLVVLREAAMGSLGIARLPELLVHENLNRNQLVTVLDDYAPPAIPLHLMHVGGRHLPPRTRAFIDFMVPRITRLIDGLGPHGGTRAREYSQVELR